MGTPGLRYISALAEGLQGKSRNAVNALDVHMQAKLDKKVKEELMALAKSKQFANRGVNIIDDVASKSVAPSAMGGAGIGGLGGFLTAPGTESENLMGKKSYTGPSLGDRLSYGLSGALMGGGVGAGVGLSKVNNLAKAIASGRKDLPPGMIGEFLETVGAKEQRNMLNRSARAVDPNLAARMAKGQGKQRVKTDWAHVDSVKSRASELENKIRRILSQAPEEGMYADLNANVVDHVLGRTLGTTKSVKNMSAQELTQLTQAVAGSNRKRFNIIDTMLSDTNIAGIQQAAMKGKNIGADLSQDEAGGGLSSILGIAGGFAGSGAGPLGTMAGMGLGSAAGKKTQQAGRGLMNWFNPGGTPQIRKEVSKALDNYAIQGLKGKQNKGVSATFGELKDTMSGGPISQVHPIEGVGHLTNKGKDTYKTLAAGGLAGALGLGYLSSGDGDSGDADVTSRASRSQNNTDTAALPRYLDKPIEERLPGQAPRRRLRIPNHNIGAFRENYG